MARREVGIVGFGRCGRLAAEVLGGSHRVVVTDVRDLSREAASAGVDWGGLADVASRPRVLLATPIRALPDALDAVRPHLSAGALVLDVASVKTRPMAWMAERLPDHVRWVGTHPLFGPDSVLRQGLAGQRIAICAAPGGDEAAVTVTEEARGLGLDPVLLSPEEHDRAMARTQAVVFLASRALRRAGFGDPALGTPSERRFHSALRLLDADSDELYEDIVRLNPHAAEALAGLRDAIAAEIDRLSSG